MKKLNHYFQKVSLKSIVLILVTTMLLTIPRMNVYSVIGNYQKSSMAITANNNFQLHKDDKEKPVAPAAIIGALVFISIGAVAAIAAGFAGLVYIVVTDIYTDYRVQHPIYPDHINYSKYDFSQFDNYTPSSMKTEF